MNLLSSNRQWSGATENMEKKILDVEVPTNQACPECFERIWTDNDIEFCKNCSWSRAVAAKPIRYNQYTRKHPRVSNQKIAETEI